MNKSFKHTLPAAAAALMALMALPGCFTGIESTAKIKRTAADTAAAIATPEQELIDTAAPQPPGLWKTGKRFIITEGNLGLAFTPVSATDRLHPGDTIRFAGAEGGVRLTGDSITDLIFITPTGATLTNRIDAPPSALKAMSGRLSVPFTIEADMIDAARTALRGKTLWTLRSGSNGRKFERTEVVDVTSGTYDYPLTVVLSSGDSIRLINDGRNTSSGTFAYYFSLSNPRTRHPQISDENWERICLGRIAEGMTREECRLALGSPASVDRQVAYNGLIERWVYENGVYLVFTDNILTSFRL